MDPLAPTLASDAPTSSPAQLLALGLGAGDAEVDLEREFDLGAFLVACPDLELHGCLGRGGMGIVFRARQVRLDRIVAVKLMAPQLAADAEFAERFEREARALARLDHPGVVRVHEFGEAAGVYYLVMEYVDGTNLRELMAEDLTANAASEIIGQLCEALAYAHARGVVHRDIKPENVLLERGGRVKVADFGLAKLQQERGEAHAMRTRRIVGTPQYMAPEQMGDPGAVDHRADIFAIGVVFYEMLTGQLPVGRFPAPSELGHGDARLDEIVLRSLESNRDKRFQAASEINDALASRHLDDPETRTLVGEAAPAPRRAANASRYAWMGLGAVAVVAVAVTAASMLGTAEPTPPAEAPPLAASTTPEPEPEPAPDEDADDPGPTPAASLTRWPARELAALDSSTAAVVGIDWSELRQAPALDKIAPSVVGQASPTWADCEAKVLERTYKVLVALDGTGAPQQLRIHGDWEPEDLRSCLPSFGRSSRTASTPPPLAPSPVSVTTTAVGPHLRYRLEPEGEDEHPDEFIVAKRGSSILVAFDPKLTEAELDALLAAPPTNTALRDRVFSRVNLTAPIFVFAEPDEGVLPIALQSVDAQVELWEKLGLDATGRFADEAAATEGATLLRGYATVFASLGDFETKPEIEITQSGSRVRVQGTFPIPTPKPSESGESDDKFGFSLNYTRNETPPAGK
jgi:predicted Ser/Thr protein kinase